MSRRFLRLGFGFGLSRTLVSEYVLRLLRLFDVQERYFVSFVSFVNKRIVLYQFRYWRLYHPRCWTHRVADEKDGQPPPPQPPSLLATRTVKDTAVLSSTVAYNCSKKVYK